MVEIEKMRKEIGTPIRKLKASIHCYATYSAHHENLREKNELYMSLLFVPLLPLTHTNFSQIQASVDSCAIKISNQQSQSTMCMCVCIWEWVTPNNIRPSSFRSAKELGNKRDSAYTKQSFRASVEQISSETSIISQYVFFYLFFFKRRENNNTLMGGIGIFFLFTVSSNSLSHYSFTYMYYPDEVRYKFMCVCVCVQRWEYQKPSPVLDLARDTPFSLSSPFFNFSNLETGFLLQVPCRKSWISSFLESGRETML